MIMRVVATHPKPGNAMRVAATHSKLGTAMIMRVAASHPELGTAMRVAATHPSNNTQWNEGGSDTPYTVIKDAMQVSKLKWGGAPTQPTTHW